MRTLLGPFCAALCLSVVPIAGAGAQTGGTPSGALEATRQTALAYYDRLQKGSGWQASFAEDMRFVIHTGIVKEVQGRDAYLRSAAAFYSMIRSVKLRELIVDGERACALMSYELQPPGGRPVFWSDVAEIIEVRNEEIVSLEIYFDTAPYPK